jgi:hypothetical protein
LRRSPFTVHRSPFTVRCSAFTVRCSAFGGAVHLSAFDGAFFFAITANFLGFSHLWNRCNLCFNIAERPTVKAERPTYAKTT